MKINVVLPSLPLRAGGGHKIMYEYANRLAQLGHEVIVYHSLFVPYTKYRMPLCLRIIRINVFHHSSKPKWFTLDSSIRTKTISKITDKAIANGDILFSTGFATAFEVSKLTNSKGKKVNLIQDHETWTSAEENIINSYKLPLTHTVINDYLFKILEDTNKTPPLLIYNAIDTNKFYVKIPIESRIQRSVCMLYSEEERKGSKYGLEAIRICKELHPDLRVSLFSIYKRPKEIPDWIEYFQSPSNLIDIYNSSAIFFSPSNGEGWALPPAEALSCGCALVCTDIGGHAAYAINNETALLVQPKDNIDMAEKLCLLLDNNDFKIKLAKQGNEYIKKFTWENSVNKMESVFKSLLD
jgi:glycosyltransferase involved in cell wall biosynthesis